MDTIFLEKCRELTRKGLDVRFCVVGAGHGGLAMAGHLGIMGYPVTLYNRTDAHLNAVRWNGGVVVTGAVEGFGPVRFATSSMREALADADIVMVVVPATAHRPLARVMAPHLRPGQIVVLNPGRTGGALEFRHFLELQGVKGCLVAEASTLLYACRALGRSEARIFRVKNAVRFACLPAYWTPEVLRMLNKAFPQFIAAESVLSTGMENIGAIFHPALTLLNSGWIEATGGDFEYYLDGISPSIARVLEVLDGERLAVAASLGVHAVSARDWLYLTYNSAGRDLYEAVHSTEAYRGIRAPGTVQHRYVTEDVPTSLVPLASLGRMFGVAVPMIEQVIRLASVIHQCDYWAEGRTVERMGLAGKSLKEIRQMVVGAT